jgi:hypothetical protein
MQFLKLPSIILLFSLTTSVSYSQDKKHIVSERIIIKSNLFNLLAKRPALSVPHTGQTPYLNLIAFRHLPGERKSYRTAGQITYLHSIGRDTNRCGKGGINQSFLINKVPLLSPYHHIRPLQPLSFNG